MPEILTLAVIKNEFTPQGWSVESIENTKLDLKENEVIQKYIVQQLSSSKAIIRDIASFMIIEFRIQRAKQKLIERILSPDTENYNGTMTYALSHLSCKNELVKVFRILTTQSFESKMNAYAILSEQEFEFTEDDLDQMKALWETFISRPEQYFAIDEGTVEMVRDVYEGFVFYEKN